MPSPTDIINKMWDKDLFSQWLGITRIEENAGYSKLRMTVRLEMCNGFGIAHGGISYSLADTALAFASNSQGRHALSVNTSISYLKPVTSGDILTATAKEISLTNRIGVYDIEIADQHNNIIAVFYGTVFRTENTW